MALSCDLTRVATIVTQDIPTSEFGAAASRDVHQDIAHNSTEDAGGYNLQAENEMTNYNKKYAEHFAYLLDQLDSIPEGGGTVLDNTAVVWVSELATGTHWLRQCANVIAGGAGGYFRTGRYVHYPENVVTPFSWGQPYNIGPAQSHLYVSLMHAMGMTGQSHFGLPEVNDMHDKKISLRGPLPRLT